VAAACTIINNNNNNSNNNRNVFKITIVRVQQSPFLSLTKLNV